MFHPVHTEKDELRASIAAGIEHCELFIDQVSVYEGIDGYDAVRPDR